MPCTPAKARHLLKEGKATPKRKNRIPPSTRSRWVAWRSWLVAEKGTSNGKGTHPLLPKTRNACFLPVSEGQGSTQAEVS
jgi:hypothetical protein